MNTNTNNGINTNTNTNTNTSIKTNTNTRIHINTRTNSETANILGADAPGMIVGGVFFTSYSPTLRLEPPYFDGGSSHDYQ